MTPVDATEMIHITTDVHLDWRDRLRVLWGRTIHVRVNQGVWCRDRVVHADRPTSSVYVDSIRPRKPLRMSATDFVASSTGPT